MTVSVLQESGASQVSGAISYAKTFSSNVSIGSALHVFAAQTGNQTITFSDNNGGSYTVLDAIYDSSKNYTWVHGIASNHASGATTVTASFSSPTSYPVIVIREIGGVSTSPLDGHATSIGSVGATTISASMASANQPAIISALCSMDAGTAFPSATTGSQDVNYGSNITTSHQLLATAGTQFVSFGNGQSNSVLIVLAAIFDGPIIQSQSHFASPSVNCPF